MKSYSNLFVLLLFSFSIIGCNFQRMTNENQLTVKKFLPRESSVSTFKSKNLLDSSVFSQNENRIGSIRDIAFSPDGSMIVVASSWGFSLYSAKDLSFVWYSDSSSTPSNARFIENGAKILTSEIGLDGENFYIISNTTDGNLLEKKPSGQKLAMFELFPDGEHVLSIDGSGNYQIFSLGSNKEITGNEELESAFRYSDQLVDNRVVTSRPNQLEIWNTEGKKLCSFNYDDQNINVIEDVASFNNGNRVIVLVEKYKQYQIDITDVCEKKVLQSMPVNNGEFESCSMDASNNGNDTLIAFGCGSWPNLPKNYLKSFYQINLMNLSSFGSILKTTDLQVKEINIIKISPKNDRILVADQRTGTLILLDINGEIIGQNNNFWGIGEEMEYLNK